MEKHALLFLVAVFVFSAGYAILNNIAEKRQVREPEQPQEHREKFIDKVKVWIVNLF